MVENKYIEAFKAWTLNHLAPILILLGIICLGSSFFFEDSSPWGKAFLTVGNTILLSGIFSTLVKSSIFTKIFKENIFDVVYGDDFLAQRGDLSEVWARASAALTKKKFPELATDVHDAIFKIYLPKDRDYYIKDYLHTETVDWENENDLIIKSTTCVEYKIIPASPQVEIPLEFSTRTPHSDAKTSENLVKFTINGTDYKENYSPLENDAELTGWFQHYKIDLQGSSEYKLVREITRTFSLTDDPYLKQQSKNFVEKPNIIIKCIPKNLRVNFESLGTTSDFERVGNARPHDSRRNDFQMRLNGIMFPRHGYMLIYSKT